MEELKHSYLGIASFVFGIICCIGFLWLGFLLVMFGPFLKEETDPIFRSMPWMMASIGFWVGIMSIFQKNVKKIFGVIGIAISFFAPLLSIIFRYFFGSMM